MLIGGAYPDNIEAMYARGMTLRESQGFLIEQYGENVSPDFVSSVIAGQNRPLEPMYPVVIFNAA